MGIGVLLTSKFRLILLLVGAAVTTVAFAERPDSWSGDRKKSAATNPEPIANEPAGNLIKPIDEVWRIVFKNGRGKDVVLDCEVARSEKDKERGLMFRKFLGKHRGMIFVYKNPEEMNFWMQNTHIALSIAFVHDKLFISSLHDMKPFSLDIVSSDIPVLYAIEVNQGWFHANSILPGNRITIYRNPQDYKIKTVNKYRKEVPKP
jgi:uncharacterized membrane protein (UPF0127 family)